MASISVICSAISWDLKWSKSGRLQYKIEQIMAFCFRYDLNVTFVHNNLSTWKFCIISLPQHWEIVAYCFCFVHLPLVYYLWYTVCRAFIPYVFSCVIIFSIYLDSDTRSLEDKLFQGYILFIKVHNTTNSTDKTHIGVGWHTLK